VFDTTSLLIFAGANFIVLDQGRKAGLLSVYGLALGTLPHALAVAFGVAGILASSFVAFNILKYLGATYLVYLGICRLLRKNAYKVNNAGKDKTTNMAFFESCVVGVLNPKAILFFLAFLPQFIDPSRGSAIVQTLALWLLSQVMAVIVGSVYALGAAWLRARFVKPGSRSRTGDYLAGGIYIGLGVAAALSGSRGK
jgi:threonine/homoserine/homoserine lactone efflux protein